MYLIYNYLFLLGLFFGAPFFLFRMATTPRFRRGIGERFGFYGSLKRRLMTRRSIWIQAASVGEVTAALPLIDLLRKSFPSEAIILTCQTATGRAIARKKLGDSVAVVLSPLDLGCVIRNLIRLTSPRILILIETEIWPGMIMTARKSGIPVVIVNGRISASSFSGYMRVNSLVRPILRLVEAFGMRSEEDAGRIRKLGAPPGRVRVTGNVKFDSLPGPDLSPAVRRELEERLGSAGTGLLIVGGSTFEGEDRLLYEAYRKLLPRFPDLRLLLAPRHLERIAGIKTYLSSRKQAFVLYTSLPGDGGSRKADVVILDTMGVLSSLYGLAAVVFIGRSLRGHGGQNPIEPAALGRPVLFGPHMENFGEIADDLVDAGGAVRIKDEADLTGRLAEILSDPERRKRMGEKARRVVESRRGASQKNLGLIKNLVTL